jgi:hypothetical protein
MPAIEAFVGGTYESLSPTFSAEEAINVFRESKRAEGGAKQRTLYGTPGLKAFIASAGGERCRGWFDQDGIVLVTTGTSLRLVDVAAGTSSVLGVIPDNGEPVSYASNGRGGEQIAIVGGGELHVLDTQTMALGAAVGLPFDDPVMVVFMDGYFLINQRDSPVVWFSALEDGESWDALDFFTRSGTADNIVGIGQSKSSVRAFGEASTTMFYNSGDADTPFIPYPGTSTEIGCASPWSIQKRGDVFTWVAKGPKIGPCVAKAAGGTEPAFISTPPIAKFLRECSTLDTLESLTYEQDGHAFYVLTCPGSPEAVQTLVWDDVENLWHKRAGWDATNGVFTAWRAAGCAVVDGRVLVGDRENDALYEVDRATYADATGILVSERVIAYVADGPAWVCVDQVELLAEVGVGLTTGQGVNPLADLWVSRDAGKTWIFAGSRSVGALGAYGARAVWRGLGRVRADRLLFKVRMSDPVFRAWTGLDMKASSAAGQF